MGDERDALIEDRKRERQEALYDLAFLFSRAIGVIWLAKHIPGLYLKPWAQGRDDGTIPVPLVRDEMGLED